MSLRDTVWITFSFLTEEARLGYSIAVTVPISMCPGASENSFLFKQLLPLEQLEQKVKILFWRMERRQILVLNILNVNASVSLITWCPFKITMWRQIRNEMPETLPFLLSHGHMPLKSCSASEMNCFPSFHKPHLCLQNQFLPLEQTTSNTSLTDDEEDSLKMYDVSSSSVFQDKSFYFTSIIVLLLSETFSL